MNREKAVNLLSYCNQWAECVAPDGTVKIIRYPYRTVDMEATTLYNEAHSFPRCGRDWPANTTELAADYLLFTRPHKEFKNGKA